jgi:hypothetical protein
MTLWVNLLNHISNETLCVLGSGCPSCAMGNKLSCSCAPLMRKAYRYEDSPWQTGRRRDGHLLRFNK